MKEKIRAEKEWLKKMAVEIRKKRKEWKENQRAYHFMEAPTTMNWEENMRERGRMFKAFRQLEQWSYEYRHRHIAYSLVRGNKYYQIERTVREGNEPNMKMVIRILEEDYKLKWTDINELPVQIEEAA